MRKTDYVENFFFLEKYIDPKCYFSIIILTWKTFQDFFALRKHVYLPEKLRNFFNHDNFSSLETFQNLFHSIFLKKKKQLN